MKQRAAVLHIGKRAATLFFLLIGVIFAVNAAQYRTLERVSLKSNGQEANDDSSKPVISSDGRYIAFISKATNLGGTQEFLFDDAYLHDRETGATKLISKGLEGAEATGGVLSLSMSADGRFTVFDSSASNLVPDDTNGVADIFLYDAQDDKITRININDQGQQTLQYSASPKISADARFIAFASQATNLVTPDENGNIIDIFVYDMQEQAFEIVSRTGGGQQADNNSFAAAISADGRYVAFESDADNLVPGSQSEFRQIFVYDRVNTLIEVVSVNNNHQLGNKASYTPSISADGRYVAFHSLASNLVPNDKNNEIDVFVYDRDTDTITRASVNDAGQEAVGGPSTNASLSPDGKRVAFESKANNLVANDLQGYVDIFVRDLNTGKTTRASVNAGGVQGNNHSRHPMLVFDESGSIDATSFIAFSSYASNLVTGDNNGFADIFIAEGLESFEPDAPTLTAAPDGETTITLTWNNVQFETGYRLEWSADGTAGWATLNTTAADVTSVQDTGLVCETTRHYRVVAFNEAGESGYSNVASATTANCPVPPRELLVNGDFEQKTGKQPTFWVGTQLSGDRLRCNGAQTFSRNGQCAYAFKGSKAENSTLSQKIDLTDVTLAAGDTLTLEAYLQTNKKNVKLVVRLRVKYTDGTPTGKVNLVAAKSKEYVLQSQSYILESANIKKINVVIANQSRAGRVYIDDASLMLRKAETPEFVSEQLRGN